jgi:diadenosine tetraphosphate (Ap4A) HIT family hydrolase
MRLSSTGNSWIVQKEPAWRERSPMFGKSGTFIEKVLQNKSQEKVIFENQHAAIIPNIDPSRPGQVLIVSKRPVDQLKELSKLELDDVMQLTIKYQHFWESLPENKKKTYSYSIFINDGVYSGQSVPHFHVQLIPIESTNPLPEGLLRSAIEPNKKGLPKTPKEWIERIV